MDCSVTLVNANEMRPPIGPIGLDYLAAALETAGCKAQLLDLTWAEDAEAAIAAHFQERNPTFIGFTLRNTDDCYLASAYSCLPHAQRTVALLRKYTPAPIVLGGCGFSIFAEPLLTELGADYGIVGDGEEAVAQLALSLSKGESPHSLPGLLWHDGSSVRANPSAPLDLDSLDLSPRDFIDNARYWREGGQGGFEAKRGCDRACIYCADPIAKGGHIRLRNPNDVAREAANLAAQGVIHLHTCDAEFSLPHSHAVAVCDAFIEQGLDKKVQWWAYCAPEGFDADLAAKMKRAGCAGIDFGADHGCDEQLARLGRDHRVEDLERVARLCHDLGIVFMFDLLLGAPGESPSTLRRTIELMKRLNPSRVGISAGVRVYPRTPLAAQVIRGPLSEQPGLLGALADNEGLTKPVFYVSPEVGPEISDSIADLVAADERFFCPDPTSPSADYNYRENPLLVQAIRDGHRGAYWDILRRLQEGLPPA
jgi:hypothetical protein